MRRHHERPGEDPGNNEVTETKHIDHEPTPTWRELGDRFRDLLHDLWDEGKDIERELEPSVLPALKRLRG